MAQPKIVKKENLHTGDVIHCYSSIDADEFRTETGSAYSHTAIYVDDNRVVHSTAGGVSWCSPNDLFNEYNHLAVFRSVMGWSNSQGQLLRQFVNDSVAKNLGFNNKGMIRLRQDLKNQKQVNQLENIVGFFNGTWIPDSPVRNCYFCSEFVVCAHYYSERWDDSGAALYVANKLTPADLAKDATFGDFFGYIIPYDDYEIREDDEYYNCI